MATRPFTGSLMSWYNVSLKCLEYPGSVRIYIYIKEILCEDNTILGISKLCLRVRWYSIELVW